MQLSIDNKPEELRIVMRGPLASDWSLITLGMLMILGWIVMPLSFLWGYLWSPNRLPMSALDWRVAIAFACVWFPAGLVVVALTVRDILFVERVTLDRTALTVERRIARWRREWVFSIEDAKTIRPAPPGMTTTMTLECEQMTPVVEGVCLYSSTGRFQFLRGVREGEAVALYGTFRNWMVRHGLASAADFEFDP